MTETKMLIGSLSNDLYRVATMMYRKSSGAEIFFREMFQWVHKLDTAPVKPYVCAILSEIKSHERNPVSNQERAETYLMYSVILQNYSLHMK